ncbi:cytochrome c biogenesis CcdA family protein [Heliophilum fasciatum]|uniref:Cytochrome c-type biogenesis protein n=1 Tax=Heliophilum fasciatum TaxID=35700 RepID=A0A4R2RFY2_9FIRM|nr:cytochrome c biogenesis protein CcdA [Heliophilum fasciatum]MCW2279208.1 cytochrome c-type biogenesis protein [Heliophilum fasciatum]TCP60997.1 cytochrome c-type biogenesis protein [Heliophilum fasciatum]
MEPVSLTVAFLAGIVSFLSPCVLPLVPAYITYLTGTSLHEVAEPDVSETETASSAGQKQRIQNVKTLGRAAVFAAGFSAIFIALGASATFVGQWVAAYQSTLRIIGGALIVFFGVHLSGLLPIPGLYREVRLGGRPKSGGWLGAFLLGMAFAAGWTPCVGPILSAIYIYAATSETSNIGVGLLTAYSLGMAIPFLLTAVSLSWVEKSLRRLGRGMMVLSVTSGAVMVVVGVLIMTNQLGRLAGYLDFLPNF